MKREDFLWSPVRPLDPEKIYSVSDLLEAFSHTSFQARTLGECFRILKDMVADQETIIFFGLSGAMVPAGMRLIISKLVRWGVIDVLVSTGANLFHDLHEAMGDCHYQGPRGDTLSDDFLSREKIDRMYDTYVDDKKFEEWDRTVSRFCEELPPKPYPTWEFLHLLGGTVPEELSILRSCHDTATPVFCPTIHDSGLGMGIAGYFHRHRGAKEVLTINQLEDNLDMCHLVRADRKTGEIIVGGGVPKNYIQETEPMMNVLGEKLKGLDYAIQLTTDAPHWGGLSGCTFSESKSWGKINFQGNYATSHIDATIGLPLLTVGLLAWMEENNVKRHTRRLVEFLQSEHK
jgi:deoxyhypusine synthase